MPVAERQARSVRRVISRDLLAAVTHPVLDLEDVREVVSGGEAKLDANGRGGEAPELDALVQTLADETQAADGDNIGKNMVGVCHKWRPARGRWQRGV